MTHTTFVKLGAALAALTIVSAAPAFAGEAPSSGGTAYVDPQAGTLLPDGSTLAAPAGGLLGTTIEISGSLAGGRPGQAVAVQQLDPIAGWTTQATTVIGDDGRFRASWRAVTPGRSAVRAVPAAQAATARAAETASAPAQGRPLTVYRRVVATWFGPGFYGRRTACGQRMTRKLLGVAHRTLPCGTPVDLFKDGRTITVPVVDRGPFRKGTSYDLTSATARALGVQATTTLGAVPYRPYLAARARAQAATPKRTR